MAGYQSFFSGSGGGGVTPATKTSGASYSSFFGTRTIANPTQQQLQTSRAQQAQQANQQRLQQQQQQAKQAAQAKANSFLGRVTGAVTAAARPITDVGGAIGQEIQNKPVTNASKFVHDTAQVSSDVSGGTVNQFAKAAVNSPLAIAREAKNKPITDIQQKTFGTTDPTSIAKKIAGSTVGTGTMFVGGGEARGATVGAKSLLAKGAEVGGKQIAKDAAIGATGNVAATATQNPNASVKDLGKSGAVGGLLGGVVPVALQGAGDAGRAATKAITTSDNKAVKAIANTATNIKTATGHDAPTNSLIKNQRVKSLIEAGQKQQATEAPPLEMKAAINPQHVKEGLINPEIKQTPVSNLAIPADNVSKLNASKVNQYSQQIKDGETLEPIVTHDINGTTHVVDGQHRLAAAQKLGIDTVPTVDKVPGATPLPPESTAPVAVGSEPPAATAPATPVAKPTGALPNEAAPAKAETPSPASVEPKSVSSPNDTAVDTPATAGVKTTPVKSESNVSQSESSATTKAAAVDQPSMTAQPSSKVSGSALKAEARAAQAGVVKDLGDKAQYDTGSYKNEEARAEQLVKNDPERAKAIALGQQPGDNPIHEVKVRQAVEKQATKEEDVQTLLDLGKSNQHIETSAAAQRMGAEGHGFDPNSPVARIKELNQARQDAYKAKTGKSANAAAQSEIKQIRAATPKATVTKETFSSFVESLRC